MKRQNKQLDGNSLDSKIKVDTYALTFISCYKWRILKQYVVTTINNKNVTMHDIVWSIYNGNIPKSYKVVHKNRDMCDNRIDNLDLRIASDYNIERSRLAARQYKLKAINILGGKCIQCGCDDIRCLEIDHIIPIKDNSSLNRGYKLWLRIVKGSIVTNIQVLCANCHSIKTWENGDKYSYVFSENPNDTKGA